MAKAIQVLIVDDSTFMRKSLSSMLTKDPRIAIVGLARNGEEALQLVHQLNPDVVTMDVEMPGMNGIVFVEKKAHFFRNTDGDHVAFGADVVRVFKHRAEKAI